MHFQKWQATGNDFIIIDNRTGEAEDLSTRQIAGLCHRKFGIGADGLMLLSKHNELDFQMNYFNSDGLEAEMCGNGARSIIAFANQLGIISDQTVFKAIDGPHQGFVLANDLYRIQMIPVNSISWLPELQLPEEVAKLSSQTSMFLNTGVPHLVVFVNDLDAIDVQKIGQELRYSDKFQPSGTNVNFVQNEGNKIHIRTYERGVENETLSCGTGAVASAIATHLKDLSSSGKNYSLESFGKENNSIVAVRGGNLLIKFSQQSKQSFTDIYLEGPAKEVFRGSLKR